MGIRWISYTQLDIAGNPNQEIGYHENLDQAKASLLEFCEAVGTDDCSMRLYAVPNSPDLRNDMIAQAKDFANIGCPFDYPDRLMTVGPKGGVRVEKC